MHYEIRLNVYISGPVRKPDFDGNQFWWQMTENMQYISNAFDLI